MESGFNGATFSQIVNTALYIVSGFFFGIFASRNSLFSVIRIRNAFIEKDFSLTSVFGIAFSVLFLILAFLVFPSWLASRTTLSPITPCCFSIFPKAGKICPQSKKSAKPRAFFIVVTLANTACSCLFPESLDAGTEQSFRGSRFRRKCTIYGDGRSEPAAGCPLHGDRSDNIQIRPVLHPPAGAGIPACRRRENHWLDARRLQRRPTDG